MAPIRNSDLLNRLRTQASDALKKADANKDGTIDSTERAKLPEFLKSETNAFKRTGSFRADQFLSSFGTDASAKVSKADKNGDGFLSDSEQSHLSTTLRDNVAALTGAAPTPAPSPTPSSTGAFGITGSVPAARVTLRPVLTQGLAQPTSVAFNPHDGTMWVVNRGDDSSVVVQNPGTSRQKATKYRDHSDHFMNNPMQIAFSAGRNEFATVQESDNDYNGHMAHGNEFMGPTLFTADLGKYEGGQASHLDMLHHSPMSVGIAAGADSTKREYWVFNGESGSLDRYYFNKPHELGGEDHHDGETYRYAPGSLKRVVDVPGHVAFDAKTGEVFVADTGNGRIARLDTKNAPSKGHYIAGHHDETPLAQIDGAHIDSVTKAGALQRPSGLLLHGSDLVVSDYATGHIKVFGRDGALKGDLDTGLGANALTGLAEGPDGQLYCVDMKRGAVLAVSVN